MALLGVGWGSGGVLVVVPGDGVQKKVGGGGHLRVSLVPMYILPNN